MYDPKSMKAEEFIDNEEILESLKYADDNKSNVVAASDDETTSEPESSTS